MDDHILAVARPSTQGICGRPSTQGQGNEDKIVLVRYGLGLHLSITVVASLKFFVSMFDVDDELVELAVDDELVELYLWGRAEVFSLRRVLGVSSVVGRGTEPVECSRSRDRAGRV